MVQDFELQAETELRLELASTDDGGGRGGEVVTVLLLEVNTIIYLAAPWVGCVKGRREMNSRAKTVPSSIRVPAERVPK